MTTSKVSYRGILRVLRKITAATLIIVIFSSCTTSGRQPLPTPMLPDWRQSMMQMPVPKKGCFTATYPKIEWQEVACGSPSQFPNPPRGGPRPNIVGNGNDISVQVPVPGLLISSAAGSFDSLTPATVTETGAWNGNATTPNAFTLQINTQFFSNPRLFPGRTCNSITLANCAWQQFIYSQNQCSGPCVFMEYWLLGFGPTCPAGAWRHPPGDTSNCFFNSASTGAPGITAAQLQSTTLTGTASAATDTVVLVTAGGTATAMAADSVVDLSQSWTAAEWNIVGDCCNAQANFSAGTSIIPRITLNDGSQQAPTCLAVGFTGETNNLSFGPSAPAATGAGPALLFSQSSAGGASSNCAAASTVGDTHLDTFGGLLYDFQASGDFVLAQVDPDFVVQARQVSGAPTWPDASVNSAVATRMGKTQVAICLGQTPLNIDGKPAELDDGKSLSLPDGADILRMGNVYTIRDQSGNTVRAEVNDTWINVAVGLGTWPVEVHGLLANAKEVNQIEASDGTVLTNPFSFEALYHPYADSWRVQRSESLLTVCGEVKEQGIPTKPFYANNLPQDIFEKTRARCTNAGVKEVPLLDACTLDVAVIGNDAAAKAFVGAPAPIAVGVVR